MVKRQVQPEVNVSGGWFVCGVPEISNEGWRRSRHLAVGVCPCFWVAGKHANVSNPHHRKPAAVLFFFIPTETGFNCATQHVGVKFAT